MKLPNKPKKVKSKNDIRFYCVITGDSISIRDTLTHEYIYLLEDTKEESDLTKSVIKGLLEMDDMTYYTLVLNTGVRSDYLQMCAKRYIDGLKDVKNTESIEWVNNAWFDVTMKYLQDNNLGEMVPINAVKALEAILAYKPPVPRTRKIVGTSKNILEVKETVEEGPQETIEETKPEETKEEILVKPKKKLVRKK